MNKRIRELAEQARDYVRKHVAECKHYGYYMEHNEYELQFEEKFSELIVQDCLGVLNRRFMGDLNREDMEVKRCIEDVKKHFGVEE